MIATVRDNLIYNFNKITKDHCLYEVDLDKDELWDVYLRSFPEGTNPIYRKRTQHDCSACRHFIKSIGNVVWIDDAMEVHSIFEFDTGSETYQPVMDDMAEFVKKHPIKDVYLSKESRVGTDCNRTMEGNTVETYYHFYLDLPATHIWGHKFGDTIDSERSNRRSTKAVFLRSLDEISMDAIDTVLELISSKTLYRGEEWKAPLERFRALKEGYEKLDAEKRDAYAWVHSVSAQFGPSVTKIRNHSIGTLLTDISEGTDLETAVRKYEAIVAPANYKRPKAIFTKRMLEEAQKKVAELGYMDSLERRFARIDDINVHDILFSNKDAARRMAGNVFDEMAKDVKSSPKNFSKVESIEIERFVKDVLPTAREMEVYFESRHAPNLVSLIAPVHREAKSMFKWDNGFSWSYSGNIADSDIKTNVKNAGGKVDGVLRFSIQWNDLNNEYDGNDLDAHCKEPGRFGRDGEEICFHHMISTKTGGTLDVDIIHPIAGEAAVENIVYPERSRMPEGNYEFAVHCYCNRGGRSGFKAEIEFDGQIYRFEHPGAVRHGEYISVATVTKKKDGFFEMTSHMDATASNREIWGIRTNRFVPVSVMMYSPNYWGESEGKAGVGNRHYMFMLDGCVNPDRPNGFYNEFLNNELIEHKRVFEALGSKMAAANADDQLSGLGFSSTRRNDIVVKVKGNTERVMKVVF